MARDLTPAERARTRAQDGLDLALWAVLAGAVVAFVVIGWGHPSATTLIVVWAVALTLQWVQRFVARCPACDRLYKGFRAGGWRLVPATCTQCGTRQARLF